MEDSISQMRCVRVVRLCAGAGDDKEGKQEEMSDIERIVLGIPLGLEHSLSLLQCSNTANNRFWDKITKLVKCQLQI